MIGELEVLRQVCERLDAERLEYMLTGSFALAYYATPRMTRDIDIVVAVGVGSVSRLVGAFARDFYVDADDARDAVKSERMFNIMHLESGIKVDFIIRKSEEYRQVEFARRRHVRFGGTETCIVSREDLILSKLLWGLDSHSELQRRDAQSLMDDSVDLGYLRDWAARLGVSDMLGEIIG
jgi:hypothetical protein